MAKLIIEGSSTLISEKVFPMTNAQALLSAEIFISDTKGIMPEGLTTAQKNKWILDQMVDKLVAYMRSETRRLSERKQLEQARTTIATQLDTETNF